jgi:hypothetical protein
MSDRSRRAWAITRTTYTTPRYLVVAVVDWLLLGAGFVLLRNGSAGVATVPFAVAMLVDLVMRRRIARQIGARRP